MKLADDNASIEQLAKYLEDARQRVLQWNQQPHKRSVPADTVDRMLAELSTSLEELSIANEELNRQTTALAKSRAEVESEARRYEELFELAPDGYLVTDETGVIAEANQAAAALFGLRARHMRGKPLVVFLPKRERHHFFARIRQILSHTASNQPAELEISFRSRNGAAFDADVRIGRGHDLTTGRPYLRWLIRDVTLRKQLESQVREMNTVLEKRVEERTAELRAANEIKDALLVGEQEARQHAEDLQRSTEFLAQAGALLAESLEPEETLNSLAKLLTETFADWCRVYVADSGKLRTVALTHHDPDKAAVVETLRRYEVNPRDEQGPDRVLKTGCAVFRAKVSDESLQHLASNDEHLAVLRTVGVTSMMIVPMTARGEVLGVITLATTNGRHFQASDLEFAKEIARRAAVAVGHARLYQLAQRQIAERRKAEDLANDLNRKLKRAMTETHHRVKNNLQLITAMIDMRLLDNADTVSSDDMRRLAVQISILARVHDLLTSSSDSDPSQLVPVEPVIDALLAMIRRAYDGRHLTYVVESMELPSRQVSALALTINELVSNALKHSSGDVEVSVRMDGERPRRFVRADVRDSGPGFPADFDLAQTANTGLELVQTLSRWDLGGQVTFENRDEGGGRVILTFPVAS